MRKLAIYSRGIRRIPHLAAFLPEYSVVYRQEADVIAGWGLKKYGRAALKKSRRKKVPFIALEDGFLRSYGLGVHRNPPLSLVVDYDGIYYDANKPSTLEKLVSAPPDEEKLARARNLMDFIRRHKLSKYNCFIGNWQKPVVHKCVLLIDQCYGDASIKYGMADESSFARMVEAARAENPGAHFLVKVHPDVISGKRKGYIDLSSLKEATIISENINPHVLFENVEKVYTVTSLAGFEALLHRLPVRCFGMPFYAGWGLTEDEITLERRSARPSLEQVFAAAYFDYARYVNPFTGQKCEAEEVAGIIATMKEYEARNMQDCNCVGFSKWKRYFVKPYLESAFNQVKFFAKEDAAIAAAKKNGGAVVVWAARESANLAAKAGDIPIYRVEDGFIRSVGLGSDFIPANSLIVDRVGIHFNHAIPSDLENILNTKDFPDEVLQRAKTLRETVLKNSITKYNTEKNEAKLSLPKGKKIILAVGQVEGDASIRLGSPVIKTNEELLAEIRRNEPEAFVVYKPHPDVVSGNRAGKTTSDNADMVVTDIGIHALIRKVDEVHTITSLVGFESLLHGKKVVVYGLPFYAGWGLTVDRITHPRRTRRRTLDELVAAALIEYPSYYDFEADMPCAPEMIVAKLAGKKPAQVKNRLATRVFNGILGILKSAVSHLALSPPRRRGA